MGPSERVRWNFRLQSAVELSASHGVSDRTATTSTTAVCCIIRVCKQEEDQGTSNPKLKQRFSGPRLSPMHVHAQGSQAPEPRATPYYTQRANLESCKEVEQHDCSLTGPELTLQPCCQTCRRKVQPQPGTACQHISIRRRKRGRGCRISPASSQVHTRVKILQAAAASSADMPTSTAVCSSTT